jgi:cation diffusion facilitator CzcD-associated flavoprotein CzcO
VIRAALQTIVIGAGPAGLATSSELKRHGVEHVVLERGRAAESWSSRVYDSLTLHTGRHMSSLPGLPFDRGTPLFVPRQTFVDYLQRYREHFALPVEEHRIVTGIRRDGDRWIVESGGEAWTARSVVVATGIMSGPFLPALAGQARFGGAIRHSSTYRRPHEFRGRRVLVVGCGNSGGEIASELGSSGVDTTISIRSGANVVPLTLLGIPIQYHAWGLLHLPRPARALVVTAMRKIVDAVKGPPPFPRAAVSPLEAIPMIGFRLVDAIRAGKVKVRGGIESFTAAGVTFTDGSEEAFDDVILATGFRAAVGFLPVSTDRRGFALRRDRVTSSEHPDLYFVGHNYDSTGALFNIRRDSRLVAKAIAGK